MEVLPNAIPLMAMAAKDAGLSINGTVKEMMALQQSGSLLSSKVLPFFAKRMSEAARNNEGLDNALLSNRVSMNRLATSAQVAAETIFKSGWGGGLTELFNTTAQMLKENGALWESIGKIIGKVFKILSWTIKNVVAPVMSAFGSILNGVTDALEKFSGWIVLALSPIIAYLPSVKLLITSLGGIRMALMGIAAIGFKVLLPFVAIIAALEEIAEFFSPTGKKTLVGTNLDEILGTQEVTDFKTGEKREATFSDRVAATLRKLPIVGRTLSAKVDERGIARDVPYIPNVMGSRTPKVDVVVTGDVILEGNKVGEIVMSSEGALSAMDSRFSENFGSNF
jgi:hypothetical protein